jgi:hypothetical protein
LHDHSALVDDCDLIADLFDLIEEVGGEEHGPTLGDEAADHRSKLMDSRRVEPIGRLIQDEKLWVGEQASGDPQALAHSERVAFDPLIGAFAKSDASERSLNPPMGRLLSGGGDDLEVLTPGKKAVKPGLFDDRSHACEGLGAASRHGAAEDVHRPGGRMGQAEQHADQRRLPGPVRPEIPERRAAGDPKVDVRDSDPVAEAFRQPGGLDRESGSLRRRLCNWTWAHGFLLSSSWNFEPA